MIGNVSQCPDLPGETEVGRVPGPGEDMCPWMRRLFSEENREYKAGHAHFMATILGEDLRPLYKLSTVHSSLYGQGGNTNTPLYLTISC